MLTSLHELTPGQFYHAFLWENKPIKSACMGLAAGGFLSSKWELLQDKWKINSSRVSQTRGQQSDAARMQMSSINEVKESYLAWGLSKFL